MKKIILIVMLTTIIPSYVYAADIEIIQYIDSEAAKVQDVIELELELELTISEQEEDIERLREDVGYCEYKADERVDEINKNWMKSILAGILITIMIL